MADKKVRFSGEDNVSPLLAKLRKESEELGRGLIKDARAYTTSGKEALSYIEEQIKAIERRNKADKQGQMIALESERQRGKISPEQFKQKAEQIGSDSKIEEQQIILLRELIETVKQSSRREIIEDRKTVEKNLSRSKTLDVLSPKGDVISLLKETLQRQQLGDTKEAEKGEKDRLKNAGQRVNAVGQAVAGSQNEFYMAAAALSVIPLVGGAISSLVQRALGAAQAYQSAAGGMSQVGGGGYGRYLGRGSGMQSIGLTRAEFLGINKETALALGKEEGSYGAAKNIAYLEKGTTASRQNLLELSKLSRAGGSGALDATQGLVRSLQGTGAIKGQDLATLDEHLSILVTLGREQLEVSGETNTNISTKLIQGISSLDESFKNPEVLKSVSASLMGGLKGSSSPQVEALQFSLLSRMNPNASLSELQIMKENPSAKYLKNTLNQLKGMSPNEEMLIQNIKGVFGLEGKTEIARKIARGEMDISDMSKQKGIENFKGRAYGATGELDRSSADWNQKFESMGNEAVSMWKTLMQDQLPDWMKKLGEIGDKISAGIEKISGYFGDDEPAKIVGKKIKRSGDIGLKTVSPR